MATKKTKKVKYRNVTEEESLSLLQSMVVDFDEDLGINWVNHRTLPGKDDTFRVTAKALSLPSLVHIMENEKVKNVYFHPSVAPSGKGNDPISLRYRLYIQYNKVPE